MFKNLQPAVKKETKRVALYTITGVIVMWIAFFALHMFFPAKIPFDFTVILGGIGGGFVAILNFFLMAVTVQQVVEDPDEKHARMRMQASYTRRSMLQLLWGVLAIVLPFVHFAAGLLPLLFPGFGIKVMGILRPQQNS